MKERISQLIEKNEPYISALSDRIWETPELGFREYKSSQLLVDALKEKGFQVETGIAGIPTAFKASFGSGKPVIGFLGEYDALANLSQEAGKAERCPIEAEGNGHGCGHNAIATSQFASMLALKTIMEEDNLPGTIVLFGCPAEECGCGKSFMTREGVFDDVDVAISTHPMSNNMIMGCSMLANIQAEFRFTGIPAHAAGHPERGRSALDAAELMVVGTQFLREHVIQEARIHHAYLDAGGVSPNVVQPSAKLLFYVRAPKSSEVKEIYARVQDIAKGAAMMTGTSVECVIQSAMTEYVPNDVLGRLTAECWEEIGGCQFSGEARKIAEEMAPQVGLTDTADCLDISIPKYTRMNFAMAGSSDVGDVSYKVPTATIMFTGTVKNTPAHSWQMVSQAGTVLMHEGITHAAKVAAYTAWKVLNNPAIADEAKAELLKTTGGSYECLIPAEIKPTL